MMTSPTELACDRIDDDCDGVLDDDGVCGGCVAFSALGRNYLSCPGPITGMAAWSGACRTTAHGYDLADFASAPQLTEVLAALARLGITDPHWIGLNDFEQNGAYVWRDRSTTFTPSLVGTNDPAQRFVALASDGTYQALTATDTRRFLCEPVLAPGPCRALMEPVACDGVDDDCDGLVDDGTDCGGSNCTASTFWDHVYYLCTHTRNQSQAAGDCPADTTGMLASIDDTTEHAFLAQLSPAEAWLGLAQDTDSAAVDVGWHWPDGSLGYGVPVTRGVHPWNPGEPNDGGSAVENNVENCGLLLSTARASELDDRACGASLPFLCERAWTY
jgi:hypothetical protein